MRRVRDVRGTFHAGFMFVEYRAKRRHLRQCAALREEFFASPAGKSGSVAAQRPFYSSVVATTGRAMQSTQACRSRVPRPRSDITPQSSTAIACRFLPSQPLQPRNAAKATDMCIRCRSLPDQECRKQGVREPLTGDRSSPPAKSHHAAEGQRSRCSSLRRKDQLAVRRIAASRNNE